MMSTRATTIVAFISTAVLIAPVSGGSERETVVSFDLTVVDESGAPLPCRVLVKSESGDCSVPANATTLATGRDSWFMSPGRVELDVPSGRALLRVEHGLEYVRFKEWIDVPKTGAKKTVRLRRWVNMKQRGYLSGENHLHVDSQPLAPMLVAEGLDFGSSLTWWRGPDPRRLVPPGDGRTRVLCGQKRRSDLPGVDLVSRWRRSSEAQAQTRGRIMRS